MATRKRDLTDRTDQKPSESPNGGAVDPNALVQHVLRESYLQTTEDLRYYAEKVKFFNACKKAIREYLQALRCVHRKVKAEAHASDGSSSGTEPSQQFSELLRRHAQPFKVGPLERDLGLPARVPADHVDSLAAFEDEIAKWEENLNTIGDDAQLANVDLQNILQKQQQTLQMMSNISKMLYDTAQSVIRKIGG
jgi:hypothetical protein